MAKDAKDRLHTNKYDSKTGRFDVGQSGTRGRKGGGKFRPYVWMKRTNLKKSANDAFVKVDRARAQQLAKTGTHVFVSKNDVPEDVRKSS